MAKVKDSDDSSIEYDTETCNFCVGNSAVVKHYIWDEYGYRCPVYKTSKELCAEMETCSATIDWDKVYDK